MHADTVPHLRYSLRLVGPTKGASPSPELQEALVPIPVKVSRLTGWTQNRSDDPVHDQWHPLPLGARRRIRGADAFPLIAGSGRSKRSVEAVG